MEEEGAEVEKVVVETDEDREARLHAEAEAEEARKEGLRAISEKNCARVQFTTASVKDIVSAHSSSILAKDGPVVPLSPAMEAAARAAFTGAAGRPSGDDDAMQVVSGSPEALAALLVGIEGATPFREEEQRAHLLRAVEAVLKRNPLASAEVLTEEAFIAFVSRFHNPAYHYGERMRKLAGRGCLEDVLEVLARGCSVNTADGEGTTALHYAAEFSRVDIVQALAEAFPGTLLIDARDKAGFSPLYSAVHFGNAECVAELVRRGASCNAANKVSKTPLHCAAAQGRVEILSFLLQHGADPRAVDNSGMSPLHEAAYKSQGATYALLLAHEDADPSARDELGNVPADYLREETGPPLPIPPTHK